MTQSCLNEYIKNKTHESARELRNIVAIKKRDHLQNK